MIVRILLIRGISPKRPGVSALNECPKKSPAPGGAFSIGWESDLALSLTVALSGMPDAATILIIRVGWIALVAVTGITALRSIAQTLVTRTAAD